MTQREHVLSQPKTDVVSQVVNSDTVHGSRANRQSYRSQ